MSTVPVGPWCSRQIGMEMHGLVGLNLLEKFRPALELERRTVRLQD